MNERESNSMQTMLIKIKQHLLLGNINQNSIKNLNKDDADFNIYCINMLYSNNSLGESKDAHFTACVFGLCPTMGQF